MSKIKHWICVALGFLLFLTTIVYADDHGNSFSTATQVSIGSITQGSIETPGDLDYFKFTISQPGKYVFYTRGTTYTLGRLYDSTYSQLSYNYGGGEADNFRIVYDFLYAGTYYIEVSIYQASVSKTGSYALHIEGPGHPTVSDDHGFSPWSATAVNIGSITSGNINLPGDLDYFKFTISQPGKYVFYTRGTTYTLGRLYDSTYSQLSYNYGGGEADNFRIVYDFLYAGTYYIEVSIYQASVSKTGSYALHIEGPGHPTVSDDHGFSPWSATVIGGPGSYPGVINLPGDLDYFRIYVSQTTTVTCYTTVNIESVDTVGRLFDAEYNLIAYDYGSGEYNNFGMQVQLYPGVYFIEVSLNSPSGTGNYVLHIEGIANACTYAISPSSAIFSSTSHQGIVTVTPSSGSCPWTAVSNVSWITVTSGSSGVGNGTVSYKVAVNNTGKHRTGTVNIAGKIFTVTQKEKMAGLPWLMLMLGE